MPPEKPTADGERAESSRPESSLHASCLYHEFLFSLPRIISFFHERMPYRVQQLFNDAWFRENRICSMRLRFHNLIVGANKQSRLVEKDTILD
jgi:hypothetical protein